MSGSTVVGWTIDEIARVVGADIAQVREYAVAIGAYCDLVDDRITTERGVWLLLGNSHNFGRVPSEAVKQWNARVPVATTGQVLTVGPSQGWHVDDVSALLGFDRKAVRDYAARFPMYCDVRDGQWVTSQSGVQHLIENASKLGGSVEDAIWRWHAYGHKAFPSLSLAQATSAAGSKAAGERDGASWTRAIGAAKVVAGTVGGFAVASVAPEMVRDEVLEKSLEIAGEGFEELVTGKSKGH